VISVALRIITLLTARGEMLVRCVVSTTMLHWTARGSLSGTCDLNSVLPKYLTRVSFT